MLPETNILFILALVVVMNTDDGITYLPTFESQKTEHEILRGSEATEGGRVWEGGGSFCIFGLKIVQSGAYLERKFGLKVWNEWR